jgi:hypothetical protein
MKFSRIVIVVVLGVFSTIFSQDKTLDRRFVPIVLKGAQIPVENLVYGEWTAFRYHSADNLWKAVPYQVDEIYEGKFNKLEHIDGVMDADDEILFMPSTLGDRAATSTWLDDPVDLNQTRIELGFTDPTDSNKKGWLYLYKGVDVDIPSADTSAYFRYHRAPQSAIAADTVKSRAYTIAFNPQGWLDYLSFPQSPAVDVLDRLKFRLSGSSIITGGAWQVSEDALQAKVDTEEGPATFRKGVIRSFHDRRARVKLPVGPTSDGGDHQLQLFPYSLRIGIDNLPLSQNILAIIGGKNLRMSLDLSESGKGFEFFSTHNREGIPINGIPDSPDVDLAQNLLTNWVMASGSSGTVVMILEMQEIENSEKKIYYRDDSKGGTNDGTDDSGDEKSFGDMGLWITAKGSVLQAEKISVQFYAYFIDEPNLDAAFGDRLLTWEQNPLDAVAEIQTYVPAGVADLSETPTSFVLLPAYPNPYQRDRGQIRFDIERSVAGIEQSIELVIFNILGQQVSRIETVLTHAEGRQTVFWDGRDNKRRPVPAGVYFYRMRVGEAAKTQKIVIR